MIQTPTGPITVTEENGAISALRWGEGRSDETPVLIDACTQIEEYFNDQRTVFDLPLSLNVSDSQRAICAAMQSIPFGETRTYGDLSGLLGIPAQAVGQGCGRNPIPLIIPCHRVLGANGLGGFSGGTGIETKVALLKHEGAASLLI